MDREHLAAPLDGVTRSELVADVDWRLRVALDLAAELRSGVHPLPHNAAITAEVLYESLIVARSMVMRALLAGE